MNCQLRIFFINVLSSRSRPLLCWVWCSLLGLMTGCSPGDAEKAPQAENAEDLQVDIELERAAPPEGMVYIPAGSFMMGGDAGEMGGQSSSHQTAYPIQDVYVDAFWMDATEVTNAQFAEFVAATGYHTYAERPVPEKVVKEYRAQAAASLRQMHAHLETLSGEERELMQASIQRVEDALDTIHLAGAILFKAPEAGPLVSAISRSGGQDCRSATWKMPEGPGSTWKGREASSGGECDA